MEKTEMVIFKTKNSNFDRILKLKHHRKRINSSDTVKYLGITTDGNLNWKHHINDISIKLDQANTLLYKTRKFEDLFILGFLTLT